MTITIISTENYPYHFLFLEFWYFAIKNKHWFDLIVKEFTDPGKEHMQVSIR